MKKIYIILGLILSLFLTGCKIDSLIIQEKTSKTGSLIIQEEVDDTNNIKNKIENDKQIKNNKKNTLLYENKQENFSFKFYKERQFEENKYGFNTIVFTPADDNIKENVGITVQQLQKFLSIQEYYEETINNLKAKNKTFKEIKSEDITINTLKGKSIIYTQKSGETDIQAEQIFLISDENKVYIINYTATTKTFDKFLEGAEEIIQSFKIN